MKYLHLRSEDDPQHRVVSVGYVVTPSSIDVQVAKCVAPDRWVRRISHEIIEARFKKYGPCQSYPTTLLQSFSIGEILASDYHPDYGKKILDATMEPEWSPT